MTEKFKAYYQSPIGVIEIISSGDSILSLEFASSTEENVKEIPEILKNALKQLDEYFKGTRRFFQLSLETKGTPFQEKVWKELQNIPYGETISYKELAARIGNEKACRAVGMANNRNAIGIIIPCHRVIGSNKKLVGYAGGLDKKEWLLNFEKQKSSEV